MATKRWGIAGTSPRRRAANWGAWSRVGRYHPLFRLRCPRADRATAACERGRRRLVPPQRGRPRALAAGDRHVPAAAPAAARCLGVLLRRGSAARPVRCVQPARRAPRRPVCRRAGKSDRIRACGVLALAAAAQGGGVPPRGRVRLAAQLRPAAGRGTQRARVNLNPTSITVAVSPSLGEGENGTGWR